MSSLRSHQLELPASSRWWRWRMTCARRPACCGLRHRPETCSCIARNFRHRLRFLLSCVWWLVSFRKKFAGSWSDENDMITWYNHLRWSPMHHNDIDQWQRANGITFNILLNRSYYYIADVISLFGMMPFLVRCLDLHDMTIVILAVSCQVNIKGNNCAYHRSQALHYGCKEACKPVFEIRKHG